jgi:AcrR family transcriptional regulator
MARRAYDRTLREAQAQQTRERVLDTVIAALAREEDVSVPALAKRAGVSVPTIYRHFPTREALLDATQKRIGARLRRPRWPKTEEELVAGVPERVRWLEENGVLIRAILSSALGRELLRVVQRERERAIGRVLLRRLEHLDPGRRRAALAIVSWLNDSPTWRHLRDGLGISAEDTAWASQWALQAVLDKLPLPTRRSR